MLPTHVQSVLAIGEEVNFRKLALGKTGFHSMKQLGNLLLPLDVMQVPPTPVQSTSQKNDWGKAFVI